MCYGVKRMLLEVVFIKLVPSMLCVLVWEVCLFALTVMGLCCGGISQQVAALQLWCAGFLTVVVSLAVEHAL